MFYDLQGEIENTYGLKDMTVGQNIEKGKYLREDRSKTEWTLEKWCDRETDNEYYRGHYEG